MEWAVVALAALAVGMAITCVALVGKANARADGYRDQIDAGAKVLAQAIAKADAATADAGKWESLYQAEVAEAQRADRALKEVRSEVDRLESDLVAGAASDPGGIARRLRDRLSEAGW